MTLQSIDSDVPEIYAELFLDNGEWEDKVIRI